jgi:hypothetical protein
MGSSSPVAETESTGDAAVPRELPPRGGVFARTRRIGRNTDSQRERAWASGWRRKQALIAELGGAKAN